MTDQPKNSNNQAPPAPPARPFDYYARSSRASYFTERVPPAEPGFYIVPQSISEEDLYLSFLDGMPVSVFQ
ncbi:hypothetical protein [Pseudomonas sp. R5(2019)]|uniref:hypothetical protein n=1 Tax=Pseudomonas sp. R5(2019) TaxID=2697566 RepID=UPI0021142E8A|nr:hypothetical protein [Pseudomonas sp. R5(2019)]